MGLMPHPEEACDPLLGSTDGRLVLGGLIGVGGVSTTEIPRHRQLGLTDDEAARIPELLGREPTDPELVMFSLMWSEHCSYKHSRPLLGRLPHHRSPGAAGARGRTPGWSTWATGSPWP